MLQSNNLSTPQNVLFTKQSTQELFTPQLRKITNSITDVAGKLDILRQGGGMVSYEDYCLIFYPTL
jgi:hypothetical protein